MSAEKQKKRNDSLTGVLIGVIVPVLILDHCSGVGDAPWKLGPAWAMGLALSLPIAYGTFRYAVTRKIDMMSSIGLVGVLCTGIVTLLAVKEDGRIAGDTPWLFASKEALIPLTLAVAVILSSRTSSPLLRVLLYTPEIFDIHTIEKKITERGAGTAYRRCITLATWMLGGSLVLSSIANFCLTLHFLLPVLEQSSDQQHIAYNYAVSSQTWWGFLVIGVPLAITLMGMLIYLVRRLGELTGLSRDQLLMR